MGLGRSYICIVFDYLGNMLGGEGGVVDFKMFMIYVSDWGRWFRIWGLDGGFWV